MMKNPSARCELSNKIAANLLLESTQRIHNSLALTQNISVILRVLAVPFSSIYIFTEQVNRAVFKMRVVLRNITTTEVTHNFHEKAESSQKFTTIKLA